MRPLRALLLLLLILPLVAPGATWAQGGTPRAAVHEGYARMVFDWDGPVAYSAEVVGGKLLVRFDKPIVGDPRVLLKPLEAFIGDVALAPDRTSASFTLKGSYKPRVFTTGLSVVVDLVSDGPTERRAPASASASGEAAQVGVRGGEHMGFSRLVFEWPAPVEYSVDKQGDKATISFARRGTINPQGLRAVLPADVTGAEVVASDKRTTVTLRVPPEVRLRHYSGGGRVVVDVVRPVGSSPPPPTTEAQRQAPLAPAPAADVPAPSVSPLKPEPAPAPPQVALAAPPAPAPAPAPPPQVATPQPVFPQSPSALPPPPAQPAKPPAPAPEPEPEPDPTAPTVSLSFSWTQSAAAAVFRRAGWLWIVFDRAQQLDINLLRQLGGSVVQYIEQVPNKHATLVRMITPPGYNATLRRENLLWVIDLSRRSPKPKTVLEVQVLRDFPPGARLMVPVADAGAVLRVGDPEIGDVMHVVPLLALNTGVYPAQSFPELELPATSQGVVAIPRVEGMELLSSRGGVDISHKQAGISASSEQDRRSAQVVEGAEDKGVLDLGSWKRADEEHFNRERASVHSLLSYALPAEKNRVRLEVARFYLAHGYAAEALGILRVIAQEEPDQVETPAFRAARGAAAFLMGRDREAIEDLSHPSLAAEPAAKLWTAAAQAGLSEPGRQAAILAQSTKYLADYPRPVRFAVAARAAQAAIRGANDIEARRLLDMLGKSAETTYETAQAEWLEGNYYEMTGGFEQAVKHWETAEEGPARPYRALSARSRLELLYKLKKIDAAALIEGLERLRFAWREESFEYPLIERLGQMLINEGRYGEGLRTLKQLATSYSEHKGVAEVTALMAKTFERLYLDGLADSMQPVTAIALFEEFRELTPTGEKGDAMIRRLADRLVAVDLLDRAAELLRHQVWYRLSGVERAKVGARLALVELFGRHPEQALESLKVSDSPDMPPDLAEQRRHLQARALDDLNRPAEALTLLTGDDSRDARLLRAEINWRHQNWAGAGEAFESLVEKPKRDQAVDDGTARIVLHWAIALTLAGDERGVGKVRRQFGPAMAQTPLNDAFSLLTSENESGLIDYRTVAGRIKQAENFQTFLTNYRQRLQTDGLSAIN